MEMICLQCGDIGFSNAFVHCVRCLDVAVHRYCLDVPPKTFDEFVHWLCDDCCMKEKKRALVCENGTKKNDIASVKIEKLSCEGDPSQLNNSSANLEFHECNKISSKCSCREELTEADEEQRCKDSSWHHKKDRIEDNLMQPNELVDARILENEGRTTTVSTKDKGNHRLGNNICKRSNEKSVVNSSNCTLSSKTRDWRYFCLEPRKSDPRTHTAKHHSLLSASNDARRSSQKKKPVTSSETIREGNKRICLENCCSDMTTVEASIDPSNDSIEISRSEISEEKTSAPNDMQNFCKGSSSKDCKIPSMVGCSELAEPVLEPIWRGIFNIWNKNEGVDGLMAHMSSRACQKVYEEARQLPPVLELEIGPKSNVWPESFETSDPSGEHIALYFFPSEISEGDYDSLVDEMVSEKLAIRAILPDAELLVFTSTELPLPYWRFQHKYYLWGVFRGKQQHAPCKWESTKGSQKTLASKLNCNGSQVPTKTNHRKAGRALSSSSNSSSSNGSGACSWNI